MLKVETVRDSELTRQIPTLIEDGFVQAGCSPNSLPRQP